MEIKINASEFDETLNNLKSIEGEHSLTSDELMTDDFIQENSKFNNWQEFMDAANIQGDTIHAF